MFDAKDHERVQDLLALDGVHVHIVVGRDVAVRVASGRQVLFLENSTLLTFGNPSRLSLLPHASQKVAVCCSSLEMKEGYQ